MASTQIFWYLSHMRKCPGDVFSGARGLKFDMSHLFIHKMCMRAAKALVGLRIYAASPENSLLGNAIRFAGPHGFQ